MKNFLHNIQEKISFLKKGKLKSYGKRRKRVTTNKDNLLDSEQESNQQVLHKTKYSEKCLQYKIDKDNYKSKRKQLKINYGFLENFKILGEHKHSIILGIILFIICIILFLLYGPIYTVKYINIFPQDSITNRNLAYSAVEDTYGTKFVNIDNQSITDKFIQYQNNIKDVDINYKYPDTLDIKISSYPILYNTVIQDKNYYVTENGTLVPGKPREEYRNMIIKSNIDSNILPDYKSFYKMEYMTEIKEAYEYLEENIIDIKVAELYYYPVEREIHFKLENDTLLIYTLSKDLKKQITKTVIYHTEHKKLTDNDVVYIDFRIKRIVNDSQKDKIYYCTKETEFQCFENLKKIY